LVAHKRNSKLVTVVPLSTTRPDRPEEHHIALPYDPLGKASKNDVWAKCDMLAVVSTARLDLIPTGRRRPNGKREYLNVKIEQVHFDRIRRGVASALGLLSMATWLAPRR
jgi:uncharacterized protein YifN (PemK superfamily)